MEKPISTNDSMKTLEKERAKKKAYPKGKKAEHKITKVMDEWKSGELHSGSKHGPVVKSQKQAVAISLSSARKASKG